jgi:GT2 family glycosyltransferase
MSGAPELSILIVTWNVREHVLACLRSIEADPCAPRLEVILVDNASADGTVEAVLDEFPAVRVLANGQNVGFPRANNQALAVARGRHVLFLNPDTELYAGTLRACMAELDANPDIGVVGCRLELPEGRIQYDCARKLYRFRHLVFELLYLHMIFPRSRIFADQLIGAWDHRGARDVEAVAGAFMMTPREVAREVGGLPDEVFMYHEDLAFCRRVACTGRRVRYLGDVAAVHHGGQSARQSSARLALLETECKYRFIQEVDGPAWAAAARVLLGVRAVLRIGLGVVGLLLPATWKRRYPRVFDIGLYWLQLRWCVAPSWVAGPVPRAPEVLPEVMRLGAWT